LRTLRELSNYPLVAHPVAQFVVQTADLGFDQTGFGPADLVDQLAGFGLVGPDLVDFDLVDFGLVAFDRSDPVVDLDRFDHHPADHRRGADLKSQRQNWRNRLGLLNYPLAGHLADHSLMGLADLVVGLGPAVAQPAGLAAL